MFVMMDGNSLSAEGCRRAAFVTTGGDVWVGIERVSVGNQGWCLCACLVESGQMKLFLDSCQVVEGIEYRD
jgi:hypothetical protein